MGKYTRTYNYLKKQRARKQRKQTIWFLLGFVAFLIILGLCH
jgi:hypothetical protein